MVSFSSSDIGLGHIGSEGVEIATLCAFKKTKPTGFKVGPFQKRVVFPFELVVIADEDIFLRRLGTVLQTHMASRPDVVVIKWC